MQFTNKDKKNIISHFILHTGTRFVSALLSLIFFSLISRVLPIEETQKAYFFIFTLGFGLAFTRLFLQIAANVKGQQKKSSKIIRIKIGFSKLKIIILPTSFLLCIIIYKHTNDISMVLLSFFLLVTASFDADLLRGAMERRPTFSLLFTIGIIASLLGLLILYPHISFIEICYLATLQWIPVSLYNLYILSKKKILFQYQHTQFFLRSNSSIILMCLFEGIILNAPFLSFFDINPKTGVDLSITMRLFGASLPLLPLLMHWANSPLLLKISNSFKVSEQYIFTVLLIFPGVVLGIFYAIILEYFGALNISFTVFLFYILLFISYSFYITNIRFINMDKDLKHISNLLLILIILFFLGFSIIMHYFNGTFILIVTLQSFFLLLTTYLIRKFS